MPSVVPVRPSLLLMGKSRANDVWHRLREDILTGVLLPGTRLRFEQLKSVYGVSFATLREALSRLATENLVVADAQRGFTVTRISIDDLLDLTRLRVMVESEAMRLSVKNGDEAWRTAVLRAFHQLDKPGLDSNPIAAGWADLHRAFHANLVAACQSPLLIDLCARLFDSASRYRNISMRHRVYVRDKSRDHREIMEAALSGDGEAAAAMISSHIWETTNNVIAAINDATTAKPDLAQPETELTSIMSAEVPKVRSGRGARATTRLRAVSAVRRTASGQ